MEEINIVLRDLEEFGQKCEDRNYTDTGDAWDLLNRMGVILENQRSGIGTVDTEIVCPGPGYCGGACDTHRHEVQDGRDGNLGEVIDRRVQVYGDPVTEFARIAEFWTTFLNYPIQAWQVPMMMMLMKVVRLTNAPDYADNSDDIEGYLDIFRKVIGEDMIDARSVNEYIEKKWPGE